MSTQTKRGSLTIAGSGIASVAHITLEALAHIKKADKVFYAVCDPVTEAFIQENTLGGTHHDLTVFYAKGKKREVTYVQMCEVCIPSNAHGYWH
jgi:siroheme synthase